MSAFIVSNQCMKNIIYNLFWDHEFKRIHTILERNNYRESEDFDRLAIEFFEMNKEAVKQRYNEKENTDYIKIPDSFNWDGGKLNKYQCLKSMECLRYQCSEGNIPKTRLYKFLDNLIITWQSYIMDGIPEYNQAGWD